MIKSTVKYALMGVTAFAIAAMPIQAQEKVAEKSAEKSAEKAATKTEAVKGEGKAKKDAAAKEAPVKGERGGRAIPFNGKLDSKSATSITVGARTFEVTAETKFVKAGKENVTIADGEVGQPVGGQYRDEGGKLVAKSIRFGPKPEAATSEKKEKPEAADKAAKKAERDAKKAEKEAKKK